MSAVDHTQAPDFLERVVDALHIGRTLRGQLPEWKYPPALRESASKIWWEHADLTLHYAEEGHAQRGRIAQCAGLMSEAACRTAHAILAHRGEWVTNEKQLLDKAGLRAIDGVLSELDPEPTKLLEAVGRARKLCVGAVRDEGII